MHIPGPFRLLLLGVAISLVTACVPHHTPPARQPAPPVRTGQLPVIPTPPPAITPAPADSPADDAETCEECNALQEGKSNGDCFKLRPGKVTKDRKGRKRTGRCQPQSLIYARCRSGITSCRLGDTSPVQWFACAKKHKATSATPKPGSVLVLDGNKRRGMPTGHPAYVEDCSKNTDGTWTLRISHTNYDRKCHLDKDTKMIFYPKTMQASFMSGPWSTWAKKLKACGFILR